jgi:ABC-type antimicrobial peptide transport system permease subunit
VDDVEIVGVVRDVKYLALGDPPEPSIYLSTEQWTNRRQTIVVRSSVENPESLVAAIRKEIESMDRLLTADFSGYTPIIRASVAGQRLAATLLVVFGIVALALATVGVYGLISYSVAQRSGEIAVRSAIGASRRQVLNLVFGQGVRLAVIGIVAGVAGAVALRQFVASQLYGVTTLDATVFVLASATLFTAAAVACFVPAQRATRIDPAELFRIE